MLPSSATNQTSVPIELRLKFAPAGPSPRLRLCQRIAGSAGVTVAVMLLPFTIGIGDPVFARFVVPTGSTDEALPRWFGLLSRLVAVRTVG